MKLKLKPLFKDSDIQKYVLAKQKNFENIIIDLLSQIGDQFLRDYEALGTYHNRTGNLRSSGAYAIYKDGVEVYGNYLDKHAEGRVQGALFIKEVAGNFKKGIAFIVVAGMEYAAAVESRGYDVLTGSVIKANTGVNRAFTRLQLRLNKLKKR